MSENQSYQRDDNPSSGPRLLADAMLGRLARWLRAAGYDTAYNQALDDAALLRQARAEDRVLLTADRSLARSRSARTWLIDSDDLIGQLTQVLHALGPPPGQFFSRCLACNGALEPADSADLADQLPAYILAAHTAFSRCPNCRRIYWQGTHSDRMRAVLDTLYRVE
jgi:uncharacterized protein